MEKEKPIISIAVAVDKNRGIGKDGDLPWDMPEDRKRFKDITWGHPVIMGRTTFESIVRYIRKPLPGRQNIILTRDSNFSYPGCFVVHTLDEALQQAKQLDQEEIFIGGGARVFQQVMPHVDRLYLTIVEQVFETDTTFPDYSDFHNVVKKEEGISNGYKYTFLELER